MAGDMSDDPRRSGSVFEAYDHMLNRVAEESGLGVRDLNQLINGAGAQSQLETWKRLRTEEKFESLRKDVSNLISVILRLDPDDKAVPRGVKNFFLTLTDLRTDDTDQSIRQQAAARAEAHVPSEASDLENVIQARTDSTKTSRIGGNSYICRNSTDLEKCLGVEQEATALSKFLKSATGELCFAVFGAWGRGKTYLMNEVSRILKQQHNYKTVTFNAWKYRSTPEVWAHLYQVFVECFVVREQLIPQPRTQRIRNLIPKSFHKRALGFRASVSRYSYAAIVMTILATMIAIVPVSYLLGAAIFLASLIGVTWIIFFVQMKSAGERAASSVLNKYGKLSDHSALLGAQSLISDDFRELVLAQIPLEHFGKRLAVIGRIGGVIIVAAIATSLLFFAVDAADLQLLHNKWLRDFRPTVDTRFIIAVVLWWMIILSAIGLTVFLPRRCERCLLIVDDLDRCAPLQMMEIIESITLLLEDEKLHDRIQVVMLIQEENLRQAIKVKFKPNVHGDVDDNIVAEHIDKLFIGHLRLWPLHVLDVESVAATFIENAQKASIASLELAQPEEIKRYEEEIASRRHTLGERIEQLGRARQRQITAGNVSVSTETQQKLERLTFSSEEAGLLTSAVCRLSETGWGNEIQVTNRRPVGPRAIRMFIVRYQLARLLLEAASIAWTPNEVIDLLEGQYGRSDNHPDLQNDELRAIRKIVSMVA